MPRESIEKFLGRILTDDEFRDYACEFFARACIEEGFYFTEEEKSIMGRMDFRNFAGLSRQFNGSIKRSAARVLLKREGA